MYKFGFEKLDVWQLARKLSKKIYHISSTFPDIEKFGLTNQLRRATVSIASNIAEGSGRSSSKDQAHFYQIAYGSLLEVMNQLIICNDLGYIDENKLNEMRISISELSNMLNALHKSVLNK